MCYNIEIFGKHLKFFLENEPALYGFTGSKTGSTFRFLFLLEHGPVQCFLSAAGEGREGHCRMLYADLKTGVTSHPCSRNW